MTLFISGSAAYNSNLDLLLTDQLLGMGTAVTTEQGSLAWCEAYALAKAFASAINFMQLMSNQLSPSDMSIFANRFANIYTMPAQGSGLIPDNLNQLRTYIGLKEAVFGTPPNYSALDQYLKIILGQIYIDLEYIDYHLQTSATTGAVAPGDFWFSPLSTVLVRVWQPRDNQDNLLMSNVDFYMNNSNYKNFVQPWMPADIAVRNLHLMYKGNNGTGSYLTTTNVISGTAGTHLITGTTTAFISDLPMTASYYWKMPVEVVDDDGNLQTYHADTVIDDYSFTTVEPLAANITNRTYRLLGIPLDTLYVLDQACFNI